MPFSDQAPDDPERVIPYGIQDYLELVDWSGRAIVDGKRGRIPDRLPPILERLKLDPGNYIKFINRTQQSRFHGIVGGVEKMRKLANHFSRVFITNKITNQQTLSLSLSVRGKASSRQV